MKRLISATLALILLGSTAAMAQDYRANGYAPDHRAYAAPYRERNANPAAAIGVGLAAIGMFAAIANHHEHYPAQWNWNHHGRDYRYGGYVNRGYGYGRRD